MTGETAARAPRRDVLDRLGIRIPGPTDDPHEATALVAQKLFVAVRWLLTPVLLVGGLVAEQTHPAFWLLLALRIAGQAAGQSAAFAPLWRRCPERVTPVADLAVIAGLLLASGGGDSPLRVVLIGLPVVAGYLVGPAAVAAIGAATTATALLTAAPQLTAGRAGTWAPLVCLLAGVLFSTVAGLTFALGRRELTRRAAEIDAARRRLLHAGLSAEDRERRQVSHDLHGEALQVLLAAAQDLDEDDPDAVRRTRAGIRSGVALLRATVRDLHPTALRHAGLEASLRAALEHRLRGLLTVSVDPGADGARETLLLSVVRELGDGLARAGSGYAVAARVSLEPAAVVLAVSAGSRAGDAERLREALAGCAEHVEADGGSLEAGMDPDGRATVAIRVPLEAELDRGDAEPTDADDVKRRAQLMFSALRVLMVPFAVLIAEVGGDPGTLFGVLIGLMAVYYVAAVAVTLSPWWRYLPNRGGSAATMIAFAVAIAAQGGVTTELAGLTLAFPFLLVLMFSPADAAAINATLGLALTAALAPEVLGGEPGAGEAAAVFAAAYGWAVASSTLLGAGRQRMRRRLAGLEYARRRLLHASLAVADEERRRLSERLHDGALQELMIAGQELDQVLAGDHKARAAARVALATGLVQLRDTVADLHPPALEHGGLRPALMAVLDRARHRAGFTATTEVAPGADGVRDEFVLALVRELVTNVTKHAQAERVTVRVARADDELELEVTDDGVGTSVERLAAAVAEGHIGLASARERVEADGGRLHVASAPGAGTRVLITLPAAPAAALA